MAHTNTISIMDTAGYLAAVAIAERRAYHSYFNQHIVEADGDYYAFDEGDYNALPQHLVDQVVHTVPGALSDEY